MNAHSFHVDGSVPEQAGTVFVFGSNLAGRHGLGAALLARQRFGAKPGASEGLQGSSYAIPTKDARLRVLTLDVIAVSVGRFVVFAEAHPELGFFVTRVGCGLAGYRDDQIAPMFEPAPANCSFAESWMRLTDT